MMRSSCPIATSPAQGHKRALVLVARLAAAFAQVVADVDERPFAAGGSYTSSGGLAGCAPVAHLGLPVVVPGRVLAYRGAAADRPRARVVALGCSGRPGSQRGARARCQPADPAAGGTTRWAGGPRGAGR